MTVEIIPVGDGSYAICVGRISYHAGRQYPWLGRHGNVVQFFETEEEATEFATTGSGGDK